MTRRRNHSSAHGFSGLYGGLNLLQGIRRELGNPLPAGQVEQAIRQRFDERENRFLDFAARNYFADQDNPVQRLVRHAGCEFGDFEALVLQDGLDSALRKLAGSGVYFSQAEFKGAVPIRRGSLEFSAGPDDFRNPQARLQVRAASSGSRGASTPVLIDLAYVRACGLSLASAMAARGGSRWRHAIWEVIGAGPRFRLLKYFSAGMMPERWFSQVHPEGAAVNRMTRWSERVMRWSGKLQHVRLPAPEYAPLNDPLQVVQWMRSVLDEGDTPHMLCYPSAGVRLSEAAISSGISLQGAQLTTGGEPTTVNRINSIRESGITVLPRYGSMETGAIGYGCINPEAVDEVHLQQDMFALIQQPGLGGLPDDALLTSILHPGSPFLYLNMSMGDAANMRRRSCGCPMCRFPDEVTLSGIHSFDKLTAGGMTFSADTIIPILEHTLPSRFGGGSADYQLVESQSEKGDPQIRIRVAPRVGELDEARLIDEFLTMLGDEGVVNRIMETYWRESNVVSVERRNPVTTRTAKTLHLFSER